MELFRGLSVFVCEFWRHVKITRGPFLLCCVVVSESPTQWSVVMYISAD